MHKILIVVLIVAVVGLAGVLVWQNWGKVEPIVNNQPPITNETANWKTYTNEKYEFEIKYPQNFIKTEDNPEYLNDKNTCAIQQKIDFSDPNLPKVGIDEPAGGQILQGAPTLSVEIADADCESILNTGWKLPLEVTAVIEKLKTLGVPSEKMYSDMFNGISWYSDGNPYPFNCKSVMALKLDENIVVKNIECSDNGPVFIFTDTYFIPKGEFLIRFVDWSSKYQESGIFDKIVSTFKFTK
jgi:hypothetical protein